MECAAVGGAVFLIELIGGTIKKNALRMECAAYGCTYGDAVFLIELIREQLKNALRNGNVRCRAMAVSIGCAAVIDLFQYGDFHPAVLGAA
jgi:hypothetical protein